MSQIGFTCMGISIWNPCLFNKPADNSDSRRSTKNSLSVLIQFFFLSSKAALNTSENFVKRLFSFSGYSISKSFSI